MRGKALYPTLLLRLVLAGVCLEHFSGLFILPSAAFAQQPTGNDKKKIPEPEDVAMTTNDGVELKATYYGSDLGKKAVPIILLHGFKGNRRELHELALTLQRLDHHAVIVPDLRGHGESVRRKTVGGSSVPIEATKLRKEDFMMMYSPGVNEMPSGDLEEVKKFLMRKNNAGELNIEKLCVGGVEMGATVALNWAAADWSWPPLAQGKQGQDVRAVVLVSPDWSFKGITLVSALSMPAIARDVSILIIAGKQSSGIADASRIDKAFEKSRPVPTGGEASEKHEKDLYFVKPETNLQGTEMLNERSLQLYDAIRTFIDRRLTKKTYPWTDRTAHK